LDIHAQNILEGMVCMALADMALGTVLERRALERMALSMVLERMAFGILLVERIVLHRRLLQMQIALTGHSDRSQSL
jgi:hypothetical protein